MKILFVVGECLPFIKTGGLADVAGALPKILAKRGHDVRVIIPGYSKISREKFAFKESIKPFTVNHMGTDMYVGLFESDSMPNVKTYIVCEDGMFGRENIYGEPDDEHRFIVFQKAVMATMFHTGFYPDIVHCHDWHTALIPIYIKEALRYGDTNFENTKSIFTIHNLGYQGRFSAETLRHAGLGYDLFTPEKLEYFGMFNFMKGALVYADKITTVSPTYAKEILTPEFGEGLEGNLVARQKDLYGIINGLDYNDWGPENDLNIPARYSLYKRAGKAKCKEVLQKELDLPVSSDYPIFGLVSRLCKQKGFEVLIPAIRDLLYYSDAHFVFQGTGSNEYEEMAWKLAKDFPDKVRYIDIYSEKMARKIYSAADVFLMPSEYEPCGLGQMISLTYGTIPLVSKTGGLCDTVFDFDEDKSGNGFIFGPLDVETLRYHLWRVYRKYKENKEDWKKLTINALKSKFTWDDSVDKYENVYNEALNG